MKYYKTESGQVIHGKTSRQLVEKLKNSHGFTGQWKNNQEYMVDFSKCFEENTGKTLEMYEQSFIDDLIFYGYLKETIPTYENFDGGFQVTVEFEQRKNF